MNQGCERERKYTPSQDTVRYCANLACGRWFHTQCLEPFTGPLLETHLPNCIVVDIDEGDEAAAKHPHFSKLLRSPIQRGPPQAWTSRPKDEGKFPFSFEAAILAARKLWLENKVEPGNVAADEAWVLNHLGFNDVDIGDQNTVPEIQRRLWQLGELPIPRYYTCPHCLSIV